MKEMIYILINQGWGSLHFNMITIPHKNNLSVDSKKEVAQNLITPIKIRGSSISIEDGFQEEQNQLNCSRIWQFTEEHDPQIIYVKTYKNI